MPVMSEDVPAAPRLSNGRDPKKRSRDGQPGSDGDRAFKAAVMIVVAAWLFLLFLAYSLRHHIV